jgi:hypothetical protein
MTTRGLRGRVRRKALVLLGADTSEPVAGSYEPTHGWTEEDYAGTQGTDLQILRVCFH